MSDFLVMSMDCIGSPNINLHSAISPKSNNCGWGFGWYPNDESASASVKDSSSKEANDLALTLSNWKNFRSTTFFCKIRGVSKNYTHQSTQPFSRSFGGRDWLFIHNGELDKNKLSNLLKKEESGFLDPIGNTDSELAFCVLLSHILKSGEKFLSDIPWQTMHRWFLDLNEVGTADFVISDGRHTVIYHGKNSASVIRYNRFIPPHNHIILSSPEVSLQFDEAIDSYRTSLVFSTCDFGNVNWAQMEEGQMMVVRRGILQWSSHLVSNGSYTIEDKNLKPEISSNNIAPFTAIQASQSLNGPKIVNIKSIIRNKDGYPLTYRAYKIKHSTKYHYDKEILCSSHILRLQPVEDQIQEVIKSSLTISVSGEQLDYEDVFGNQAIHLALDIPYNDLEFVCESEIRIYERPEDDYSSDLRRVSIPLVWMPWQRQMMSPYLLPLELPETQLRELTEFAMSFVERNDYNLLDTLREMNRCIFQDFTYQSGSTTNETSPFEVYSTRMGVCQDFANLFICLARLLNIPARYRVGYIYTGSNYENKEQSDASHAWAEVYLPYIGWRGFDPTNGCIINKDHIRVACGRNYRDATPTSGTIFKGGGNETLEVEVKVEEI